MISVRAMSATPMLGRMGTKGERPLFNCLTRWDTRLTKTSGSVTISEALSRRSLFIGEPGNREIGGACSNGMTFFGSSDGSFSLKIEVKGQKFPELTPGRWSKQSFWRLTSLIWMFLSEKPAARFTWEANRNRIFEGRKPSAKKGRQ